MKPTPYLLLIFVLMMNLGDLNAQTVDKLMLINASSNTEIREIPLSGDTIDLDVYSKISFRAVTNPEPLGAGQCVFNLTYPSGATYSHSEGTPVYACFGDNSGDYNDWESGFNSPPAIESGAYTLKVTPGSGIAKTFSFAVLHDGGEEPVDPGTGEPFDTLKVADGEIKLIGELKQWHDIVFNLGGPVASEGGDPNPFSDYRLEISFTKGSRTLKVPGYFAADGNAHETGASEGNVWRAHFCPPETGSWDYTVSFRSGTDVAITDDEFAGSPVAILDGITGTVDVSESDKSGRDLRGKGRLTYVGAHHLQFAGTGQWFVKAGADSPENFLAYEDFDNTPNNGGYRKSWAPHEKDWREGDPIWRGDKGKGIIGAVNYLASKGLNAFSFLTMNAPQGDDKNVFMWTGTGTRDRYDCSKLDQWELVFSHAESRGMYLHFKTQETENEVLLDNGDMGRFRKLYYRELIARYGHHLALNWNLGEENGDYGDVNQTDAQRKAMAAYFNEHDPYENHIVIHTSPSGQVKIYPPLLGSNSQLTGASIQTGWANVHNETLKWIGESASAGKKWVVANDEQNGADIGVPEDGYTGSPSLDQIRTFVLWGNLMAGGGGVEYYFGYQRPESDLTLQDFRSRDESWGYCKVALDFFNQYVPYWEMTGNDGLTSSGYCFAKAGEVYTAYLPNGGAVNVNLAEGNYDVDWYNPRIGGPLVPGLRSLEGGVSVSIGDAPNSEDWVALIRESEFSHPGNGAELYPCGDDMILTSYSDFPNYNVDGFRPAYKDEGNQVLAINAVQYKDEYAAATSIFEAGSGIYNVTITTLTELDGESTYHLAVNGNIVGSFTNPETTTDYAPVDFTWENIEINTGDEIRVEFNSHTNGKIPEGDITAYSRGRWKQLAFTPMCNQGCTDGDAFEEKDGYVVIEMESVTDLNAFWSIQSGAGSLGDGYIQYEGSNHMSDAVEATTLRYKVQINTPGTYQFKWRTRRGFNSVSFDGANDTWLKILGSDFYGTKNGSKVACKDHFMKVWVQNDVFGFNCWGEHNGVNNLLIYAEFDVVGEYIIEVSGRSQGHVIDRMALYLPSASSVALDSNTPESSKGCGGQVTPPPPPPPPPDIIHITDMYLAYDTVYMIKGEEYQLRHTILPDSAEDKRMSWSAQNSSVVSVDTSGILRAVAEGQSRVYGATVDMGIRRISVVRVLPYKEKVLLEKSEWNVIFADSEDSEKDMCVKENAIDDDLSTYWHTQWFSAQPALPHEIQIDLGSQQYMDIIEYYPRQDDWGPDGAIGAYEIYVSNDGLDWGDPVHKDYFRWPNNASAADFKDKQRIFLDKSTRGQFLKIVALSEAQKDPAKPFTAMAELDLWAYVIDHTGMDDLQVGVPAIYPNPFEESFTLTNLNEVDQISVLKSDGRVVKTLDRGELESLTVNTETFDAGVYFITYSRVDGSTGTLKAVKY